MSYVKYLKEGLTSLSNSLPSPTNLLYSSRETSLSESERINVYDPSVIQFEREGVSFKNLIVVDVQPLYEKNIEKKFSVEDFYGFLRKSKNVLYFYNGPETIGSEDSPENIINWLDEKTDYKYVSDEESENISRNFDWDNVNFYDKGYSFFRDWMDAGVSDNGMKQALRYMYMNRKNDSRDISIDEWKKVLPQSDFNAIGDALEDGGLTIWTPDISIADLKNNWNNSLICGGSLNECLKEIMLLMNAFNIKYTLVDKFIYI